MNEYFESNLLLSQKYIQIMLDITMHIIDISMYFIIGILGNRYDSNINGFSKP